MKHDLPGIDHLARPTGEVLRRGSLWTVVPGSESEPSVVWLHQPNGVPHTWDETVLDTFDLIASAPPVGARVVLSLVPEWVAQLPEENQRLFGLCAGHPLPVAEIDSNGLVVLDASEFDPEAGGRFDHIRVEAELIQVGSSEATPTLRAARARYFAAASLPADGGYGDSWVRIRLGPFPFAYPNSNGRRRVAPAHDLHHVLTGYGTDLTGEGELAAWELGAGCRDRAGLQLELRILGFALAWCPRRLFRAFLRGRQGHNLLGAPCHDDAFLQRPVASVRRELGLDRPLPTPRRSDRLAFAGWAALAAAIVWGPSIPLAALLWWWVR